MTARPIQPGRLYRVTHNGAEYCVFCKSPIDALILVAQFLGIFEGVTS